MSIESDSRSPLMRFLDSFFQEQNIKWMLGIGMLIFLGSSLMLVTAHWATYTPVWKYLILVSYTAGVFAAGQISYHNLGLRRTGTGLMALTVLLLPITFLALRWIQPIELTLRSLLSQAGLVALLAVNFVFSLTAARRIFDHFLRGPQPTFLGSYLALCVAGAFVPVLPSQWSPWIAVCLWAVFAIGTVKVNRHVFWLTEEHRMPRIFGFFPIALLGTQFITLFALCLATHVPLEWIGFDLVLAAVPVLLTADTVARVFQQRTGDLIRPLPWSIVVPFFTGLSLCTAGVCLSAAGMPRPYALVPTGAVAAALMAVTARRTGKSAFVWMMLAAIVAAYNFSPVFFQEFARSAVQQGAVAVREARLPYAFYGLTYLPLLAALTAVGSVLQRRGIELFAAPIRRFSIAISCLLVAVSFSHAKAVFPVGLAMTAMFAAQTMLYRDRRLMTAGVASWIAAALGFTAFATGVLGLDSRGVPPDMTLLCLAVAATLLLWPGRLLDRLSSSFAQNSTQRAVAGFARIRDSVDGNSCESRYVVSQNALAKPVCQLSSLLVTLIASVAWVAMTVANFGIPAPWFAATLLTALLFVHALVWLRRGLGETAIVFAGLTALMIAGTHGMPPTTMISAGTVVLGLLWLLSYWLLKVPESRVSQAFAKPCYRVSLVGLTAGLAAYYLPQLVLGTLHSPVEISWLCTALIVAWVINAAWRVPSRLLAILSCLSVLGVASALLVSITGTAVAWQWIPVVWSTTGLAAMPLSVRLRRNLERRSNQIIESDGDCRRLAALDAVVPPLDGFMLGTFVFAAVISLAGFTVPLRIAAGVGLVGMFLTAGTLRQKTTKQIALVLLNWQILCSVVQLFTQADWMFQLTWNNFAGCSLPLALFGALSILWWQVSISRRDHMMSDLIDIHIVLLRWLIAVSLFASLSLQSWDLSTIHVVLAAGTFAAVVCSELWSACRHQHVTRVWLAEAIIVVAVGYFAYFGLISFGHGISMFAVLISGFLAWGFSRLAQRSDSTAVMCGPLRITGMTLPLLAVGIGVGRHLTGAASYWIGLNSLALLLAAGFYFWRGLEHRRKEWLVLSATVLNVALTLLWGELDWRDPQFFMIPLGISVLGLVELLKSEIPEQARDPLRYAGALVILVSPTFHIVEGSWAHLLTLMICSVLVALISMGIRVRALLYTGTGFLLADLLAMVVRGSIDHPNVLWIAGLAVGTAVITLAAICEKHRDTLLQRLRLVSAELQGWE